MPRSLVFTKRSCQAFACLEISKQTGEMKISDIRREKLRAWFADRSVPEREKSYISQLMTGKCSFGEKAARRLESDLGMPDLYLDSRETLALMQDRASYKSKGCDMSFEEQALLKGYRDASRSEQLMVLKMLDIRPSDFAKSA